MRCLFARTCRVFEDSPQPVPSTGSRSGTRREERRESVKAETPGYQARQGRRARCSTRSTEYICPAAVRVFC